MLTRDLEQGLAANTIAAYATGQRQWVRVCWLYGWPLLLHASSVEERLDCEDRIMIFAEVLARSVSSDTISNYICGVRSLHVVYTGVVPWEASGPALRLARVLHGIARRVNKPKKKRSPVTVALLLQWRTHFDMLDPTQAMLWAALVTAFFGLLRKSEFAVGNGIKFDPSRHLTRADATFFPTSDGSKWESMDLHIRFSKTEQRGTDYAIPIAWNGSLVCAMTAVQHMCRLLPAGPQSPLFQLPDGRPLSSSMIVQLLRSLVQATPALANDRVLLHSLRIGGTVALQEAGASEIAIQLAGRWRSDAWKAYVRFSRRFVLAWSRRMVDGSSPVPSLRRD